MTDMSMGFSNMPKQYSVQQKTPQQQQKVETQLESGKGSLGGEDLAELANPTSEYFAALEETKKKKKLHDSSMDDLEQKYEKLLLEKYDNAHNMLAEAFSGFKLGVCSGVLALKGANPGEIEAIQKRAYEKAKDNVRLGYGRLASAEVEFEIYT